MRHAFVVPRYGREVVGGAELAARLLAEHLVADDRAQVEVFTTTALDHRTWAGHYPPGTTVEEGVIAELFTTRIVSTLTTDWTAIRRGRRTTSRSMCRHTGRTFKTPSASALERWQCFSLRARESSSPPGSMT